MNVHFIAIGGSAMHNLAIALYKKGYSITGSDDEIFQIHKRSFVIDPTGRAAPVGYD